MKISTMQSYQEGRELCQAVGGDLAHVGVRNLTIRM